MEIFPLHLSDYYKVSHAEQYPAGTENIYSNLTARNSRLDGVDKVVFFGLQYFIKEYLQNQFKNYFFGLHEKKFDQLLAGYKRRLDCALGGDNDVGRWRDLYNLGYLPLEIKALPEGAKVPLRVPLITIINTKPEFFWLGQWMETLLSNVIWYPITTATISYQYKKIVNDYFSKTSDDFDWVKMACHDFSMRGNTSVDSSSSGGAGHLLSFAGTDTIPAIDFLERYYSANAEKELIGGSIPSTEHSVMCVGGKEGEYFIYQRLLTQVYPTGNVGIVSDTYDLWKVLTDYIPRLKNIILSRNGKMLIRPDSGNPVDILCGKPNSALSDYDSKPNSPEDYGVIRLLWDTFGGTINSKGYKQLDNHIGAVYGDSITPERCKQIYSRLAENGFASSNVILGIGSYSFQYNTRDTLGLAIKCTAAKVNGEWRSVYKDPITDSGLKKSARGLLQVLYDCNQQTYILCEDVDEERERSAWNQLKPIFRDGVLLKEFTLKDIRSRLESEDKHK